MEPDAVCILTRYKLESNKGQIEELCLGLVGN